MVSEARIIELHYRLEPELDAWVLPEVPVPESHPHDLFLDHLKALLAAWVARTGRDAIVARNLAVRWVKSHPKVGVDPDLCLIEPPPPRAAKDLESLCLWKPGHVVPKLAIEVVSRNHPYKDYVEVHEKYAACGIPELWVLDPRRLGPKRWGGPHAIQIWRGKAEAFERVYQGDGPARADAVGAWLVVGPNGITLGDDERGEQPWLTMDEAARAEAEASRAQAEAALARVRELEAKLAGR